MKKLEKVSQTLVGKKKKKKEKRAHFFGPRCINATPRSLKASAHYAKLPVHRSQLQPRRGL